VLKLAEASLRAKRSNPEATKSELDCFVASLLAMTDGSPAIEAKLITL
jgi:hypothetical protein